MRVLRKRDDVRDACDGADPGHVVHAPDRPADVTKDPKEHTEHEDEPELGLVNTPVPLGYPDDTPVV